MYVSCLSYRIVVPFTKEHEYVKAYKQAKRKDDDIAIVNAGLRVNLEKKKGDEWIVEEACFSYGGMGPFTTNAKQTADVLIGKPWNPDTISSLSMPLLLVDMPMSLSTPGGQVEFRKSLSMSFMQKFIIHVTNELSGVEPLSASALLDIKRGLSCGTQTFTESSDDGIVGKSVIHQSAMKQVTGEACYVDDMPKHANELYAVIVQSSEAHAKILNVDYSEALSVPGVVDYISWKDIPGYVEGMKMDEHNPNVIGPVFRDEELFATNEVHFVGQMLGMILAETEGIARDASRKVRVVYQKLETVFTIEEAIEKKSFFSMTRELYYGDFSKDCKDEDAPLISEATEHIEGKMRMV
jgi:xanthine dehydrogenase/oxidase